ncbi:MAG TPA: UpxY family transcription antiterminator [Candidatus Limnocylindrales bacterium]|nr:UpxY family transcription antiterminator [Candidatus Limnocylindrales bacterium]
MDQRISHSLNDAFVASDEFFAARWYALFVRCNQEKRVCCSLQERSVEHFLPCYSSLRHWKDRRVLLEMPLFPGYVFIRLPLVERLKALTVPNVVSLVGPKDCPSVISEQEIAWIRGGVAHGNAEPHEYLRAGQRVMIAGGPLSDMEGILLRRSNGARVVISLISIARSFAVEVDASSVKVLDGDSRLPVPSTSSQSGRFRELCAGLI